MTTHQRRIELETGSEREVHDLTPRLCALVAEAGMRDGYVVVSSAHTTCAVTINENEPRLVEDLMRFLERLAPKSGDYLHNDIEARGMPDEPRNAHAHLAAMLLGASQVVAVEDGALVLGTWQSVLFVELDGPRPRTVRVQIGGAA